MPSLSLFIAHYVDNWSEIIIELLFEVLNSFLPVTSSWLEHAWGLLDAPLSQGTDWRSSHIIPDIYLQWTPPEVWWMRWVAVGTYHRLEELVPGWGCPEWLVEWSLLGPRWRNPPCTWMGECFLARVSLCWWRTGEKVHLVLDFWNLDDRSLPCGPEFGERN